MQLHSLNAYNSFCAITSYQNYQPPLQGLVIGVDEVGRGSLFGQMTVGAVILSDELTGEFEQMDLSNTPLSAINDSKKLSAKKREQLFEPIKTTCQSYALVDVPANVIDCIDIHQATMLGMRLAIEQLIWLNGCQPNQLQVLIDGSSLPVLSDEFAGFQSCLQSLIKGDGRHTTIACASILAKVHRDESMNAFAKRYPNYGLENHKGYASRAHTNAIYDYGILPEHRKSFNPMRTLIQQGEACFYNN